MFKKLSLLMFMSVFVVQINAASDLARAFASVSVPPASLVAVRPAGPVAVRPAGPVAVRSASPVAVRPASPVASAGAGAGAGDDRTLVIMQELLDLTKLLVQDSKDGKDKKSFEELRVAAKVIKDLTLKKYEAQDASIAARSEINSLKSENTVLRSEIDYYRAQETSFSALRKERDQALLRAAEAESLAAKFTV